MTKAPPRIGDFLDSEMYGDAPPRQKRPQPRVNALEAAILNAHRQRAHRPPPRRTALSIIRRIVATIRKVRP